MSLMLAIIAVRILFSKIQKFFQKTILQIFLIFVVIQ